MRAGSASTVLIPGLAVAGLGVGMVSPIVASAALAAVPTDQTGMAGGAVSTFRQVGFSLGVAVFGTAFSSRTGAGAVDATMLVAGATRLVGGLLVLALVHRERPGAAPDGPRPARGASAALGGAEGTADLGAVR